MADGRNIFDAAVRPYADNVSVPEFRYGTTARKCFLALCLGSIAKGFHPFVGRQIRDVTRGRCFAIRIPKWFWNYCLGQNGRSDFFDGLRGSLPRATSLMQEFSGSLLFARFFKL